MSSIVYVEQQVAAGRKSQSETAEQRRVIATLRAEVAALQAANARLKVEIAQQIKHRERAAASHRTLTSKIELEKQRTVA